MNASKLKQLAKPQGLAAAMLVFATASALLSPAANANTAANTVLRNSVSVSFADANNNAQTPVTAQVDITVNLVAVAASTAQVTADATIAPNATQAYTYSITTNANGPDTYAVSRTINSDGTPTSTVNPAAGYNITLGATLSANVAAVNIAASGGTGIVAVPADGTGNAALLNDLAVGDIVVVDGSELTVSAINSNPATPGTGAVTLASIELTNNTGSAVSVDYGDLIAERQTFSFTVDPGTYTGPGDKTIVHFVDATDGSNASTQITTTTTVAGLTVSVTKYVRNVTTSVVGGGSTIAANGTTYYTTGVNANPGNTLEYLIVIENATGSSSAQNVIISDGVPAFTAYVGSSMKVVPTTAIATLPGSGAFNAIADATADNDAGEFGSNTVTIFAGVGGDDTTNAGGSLAGGQRTYGLFQVTVE